MTIAEAITQFESRFKRVVAFDDKQTNFSVAPNGERYRQVSPGGLREEGEPEPVLCASEKIAAVLWLQAASQLAGKSKTLYWRIKPEIEWRQITEADARQTQRISANRCAVYSRMAFGD